MSITETYVISTDTLNGTASVEKLGGEIEADAGITKTFEGAAANVTADQLKVQFDLALTAGEKTTLDGIVAAHDGVAKRLEQVIAVDVSLNAVEAGVSIVIANGFLAVEVQNGITGFAATHMIWPLDVDANATLCIRMKFIMKASGTGSNIRLGVKAKAQSTGEDSSAAFSPEAFLVVPITYTTVGEVFEGAVELDGSGFKLHDAVGLQIGRDGNNAMGAGTNDDANVAIQIIAVQVSVI